MLIISFISLWIIWDICLWLVSREQILCVNFEASPWLSNFWELLYSFCIQK